MTSAGARRLAGRVAIVTGAGRGLGRAYALALAAAGARVVVNDAGCDVDGDGEDPRVATHVAAEIQAAGGEAVANPDAIGTLDAARRLVGTALATWGRLDVLVNNAGITRSHALEEFPIADWDRVIAVHLTGTFTCAREAFRAMREGGRGGRIVNITSGAGIDAAYPLTAAYAAAKAGIVALTRVIAAEGAPHGITCNAVAPLAHTRMSAAFVHGMPGDLAPERAAPLVVYLASDLSADVTGETFRIRHGAIALTRPHTTDFVLPSTPPWTLEELAAHIAHLRARA